MSSEGTYEFMDDSIFGLSKEGPILGDHPKAHILDFMKSGGFQVKYARFHTDVIKSGRFRKTNCQEW